MFVAIKFLIITLILSSCITVKFKFKQENSILITFLTIGLLLYVLGLFNIMKFGIYLIIFLTILGIIYLVYKIIKKEVKIKEIFTVGTILYILAILFVSVLVRNTYYREWDEFSHWGSNLKAMVAYDVLWSNNLWDGVHVVYPPLAGIIEYFICKLNGSFSEAVSYFAVDAFFITLLLPILRNLKYKAKDVLIGIVSMFIVFCLVFIFRFSLTSIYIDIILAMLSAIGLYIAFKPEKIEDKILLTLILISLVVLKDTGLVFAGIILILLGINNVILPVIKNKKIDRKVWKNLIILFTILAIMIMVYISWKIYCKANDRVLDYRHDTNSITQINIKEFIKAVTHIRISEGKAYDISNSFYSALNNSPLLEKYAYSTAIQLLAILNIVGIVLYWRAKEREDKTRILTFLITMDIGFALYCLVLMATFMYAFTEQEGRNLASYGRYMPTYFLAWVIPMLGVILRTQKNKLKIFTIIALVCVCGMSFHTFVRPTQKGVTAISENMQTKGNIILNSVELKDKVYIIYQQSDGFEFHQLRYCISPIRTNLVCEWSLGEPTYEGFIWNYNISLEEFKQKLINEQFDYVFVARSDENLISKYGSIFEENIDLSNLENKIFKVQKFENNNVKLKQYNN